MLSGEAFHPLKDVESMQLMEGQVNITLDFFGERGVRLQFESWQKYWLVQITGTSTMYCRNGTIKRKHIFKTTWEIVWEGRRETEKWGWLSTVLDITAIFIPDLCCKLKRLCSCGQSPLLSSFPLCSDTDSQMRPLSGFPNESAHFKLKI